MDIAVDRESFDLAGDSEAIARVEVRGANGLETTDSGPQVVFIAGAGRSGSTLLGDALAQMPGCIHVGELRFLFEHVGGSHRICGCGVPLAECEFWQAVLARAFDHGSLGPDLAELSRFSVSGLGYRGKALLKLRRQARSPAPVGASARHYAEALRRVYAAVADVSGSKIVIDSSKIAMHVYLGTRLAQSSGHIVHVVRDPRAVAYSWRRRSVDQVTFGPARVSMSWVAGNLAIAALDDPSSDLTYSLVRYEEFIRHPKDALARILEQIGIGVSSIPLVDETRLWLDSNHTVAGNPSRFRRGEVRLVADDEWQTRMNARDRLLATIPAIPLLRRYSYPLRVRAK